MGLAIMGLIILYPEGNLAAIDAFFLGVSAGTVTGLTTLVRPFLFPARSLMLHLVSMWTISSYISRWSSISFP